MADEPKLSRYAGTNFMISTWDTMFVAPPDLSYEPGFNDSIAGIAEACGIHVREALMDVMASGRPLLHLIGQYEGNLEKQRKGIAYPNSVFALGDGGAHCGVLCDASMPTCMLAYMSRDRTEGPTLALEFTIHKMTQDTAQLYGLDDRGVIAEGYKADLNIIDFEKLSLVDPEMIYDLPASGRRLIQKALGYVATICIGEVTYENGRHTGAMPGRLLRGLTSAAAGVDGMFIPQPQVLPPSQRWLSDQLDQILSTFVLYRGTTIALHLGHRQSVDFDFFGTQLFEPRNLALTIPSGAITPLIVRKARSTPSSTTIGRPQP